MSSATNPAQDPAPDPAPRERPPLGPLPIRTKVVAGVLLLIPMIALALVGTYSSETPKLWGFPFFYWYQLLWVFITAGLTYAAYVVVTRGRGERR